jgi:hypothetical protein
MGHGACMGRKMRKGVVGKAEEKRQVGKSRHRWEKTLQWISKINILGGCGLDSSGS